MARAVVCDVMVPYDNERELACLLLYEIGRGGLDRAFVELVADPAAFFCRAGRIASRSFVAGVLMESPSKAIPDRANRKPH